MDAAPPPSPEDRAAAAARAIRARREADAADEAAARTRGHAHASPARRRALIVAGTAAALLAAAAVTWGVVQNQPPAPLETVARPTATSTPTPTPTPTPSPTYTLVQVGEDLIANPPEGNALENIARPDELVAATALGERAGWIARGMLSDAGRFCISVHNPGVGGYGNCVPGDQFMAEGITVDRGSWEVTWLPDGTVTWTGI